MSAFALIPAGLGVGTILALRAYGDRLPIWSCPAVRNISRDAADDFTPYAVLSSLGICAVATVALILI